MLSVLTTRTLLLVTEIFTWPTMIRKHLRETLNKQFQILYIMACLNSRNSVLLEFC